MRKLEEKIKEVKKELRNEYSSFEFDALDATVERIEDKHGKFKRYDELNVTGAIDQFAATYPGLYDAIVDIVESVSRSQLPEVQFMFCLECARHLAREE